MKRSDLLEIIDEVIANSRLSGYCETGPIRIREMERELADDILSKIEEAGITLEPVNE